MKTKKDELLEQLVDFIRRDSAYLSRNDIDAIETHISQLDQFINERYAKNVQQQKQ